jgi:hypothetical protein
MNKPHFVLAGAALLSALAAAPAFAAPAVAWEDNLLGVGEAEQGGNPSSGNAGTGEDMFGSATVSSPALYEGAQGYYDYDRSPVNFTMPYVPNYVAPAAPPPASIIYVDSESGDYCREYSQRAQVGNRTQEVHGTVCMQPDGSWWVVQ